MTDSISVVSFSPPFQLKLCRKDVTPFAVLMGKGGKKINARKG